MIKDKCCDWPKSAEDGVRIMATARYPRGRTKETCDAYMPEIAPDWENVQALRAGDLTWAKFSSLYRKKLREPSQRHQLELLAAMSETFGLNVTVMCACEEREHCHRSILVEEIREAFRGKKAVQKVSPYCVYHIKHSQELERLVREGETRMIEKGNWRRAEALLAEAKDQGEDFLLFLDHAEAFQGVSWRAVIESISIRPLEDNRYETHVQFKNLERLATDERFCRTTLRRASSRELIDDNYQRGYVPCLTPAAHLRTP